MVINMEYTDEQVRNNIKVEDRAENIYIQMYLRHSGDVKITLTRKEAYELYLKLYDSSIIDFK